MTRFLRVIATLLVALVLAGTTATMASAEPTQEYFDDVAASYFDGDGVRINWLYRDQDNGDEEPSAREQRELTRLNDRLSEMVPEVYVAQMDHENYDTYGSDTGAQLGEAINDYLSENFNTTYNEFLVVVVVGDTLEVTAYGDFHQDTLDDVWIAAAEVNDDAKNQAKPHRLLNQWIDKVNQAFDDEETRIDNGEYNEESVEPTDEASDEASASPTPTPTPTVTVTHAPSVQPDTGHGSTTVGQTILLVGLSGLVIAVAIWLIISSGGKPRQR